MIVTLDTNVFVEFLEGSIENPYEQIHPYRMLAISPVVLHETLRGLPEDLHELLASQLREELLPPPTEKDWIECAAILKKLYPFRKDKNVAKMQNDILIVLAARNKGAPVWSRDGDFKPICDDLNVELLTK